jgi:hypothetical protein
MLEMVARSPTASVRRMSDDLVLAGCKCGRTLHDFGLYPCHVLTVQDVQPITLHVQFCHWLLGHQQLHTKNLFIDKLHSA